jgi:hypothetical protein
MLRGIAARRQRYRATQLRFLGSWDGGHIEQLRSSDLNVIPPDIKLVGTVAEVFVDDLSADGDEIGVGDPGAVEAIAGLTLLVLPHLGEGAFVDLGIPPARNERRHASDSEGRTAVTGGHEVQTEVHEGAYPRLAVDDDAVRPGAGHVGVQQELRDNLRWGGRACLLETRRSGVGAPHRQVRPGWI